jgi:hypothetical protein
MSNIEFTTRGGIPTTCDSCDRPTTVGFWHLHRGTPVLFDCVPCAERLVGTQAVATAIEAHKEVAHLRMETSAA